MPLKYAGTFLLIILVHSAHAQDLSFSSNARTFETISSGLLAKSLAFSCLTLFTPDSLPCSPSMTTLNQKPYFSIDGQVSNGYSAINNVTRLLKNDIDQKLINDLFAGNNTVQIDAGFQLNFMSKYFNAQYSPAAVRSFLVVRNEANPDVEIYSVLEDGYMAQTSYPVFESLFLGLQVRHVDRKFIKKRIKLFEIVTDAGKTLLKPKNQTATYFEPALTWFTPLPWKTRVSMFVSNLGVYSERYDEIDTPVNFQGGIGFSPPIVGLGNLELSLEYRSLTYIEEEFEKLRVGALYKLGSMHLASGIDANGISGGVFYALHGIHAGITYSTTRFVNDSDFYTQTVYVQLGYEI